MNKITKSLLLTLVVGATLIASAPAFAGPVAAPERGPAPERQSDGGGSGAGAGAGAGADGFEL